MPFGCVKPVPAVKTPYCSGAVPIWVGNDWMPALTDTPYHGSGYVPNSLTLVTHGTLFLVPSQKSSRLGSFPAALQLFVNSLSVAVPPDTLAPPGSRELKFSSMLLYQRCRFGSLLSTNVTALTFAALML